MLGDKIASVTLTGWQGDPVTYLAPHSFDVKDGVVTVGMASTTTAPRTITHYPLNSLKFFQVTLG